MNIFLWILRVAAGRFIFGILLIFLGCTGLNMPTLEEGGEVVIQSGLWNFGLWPFWLSISIGIGLMFWAYLTAKDWRGY